MGIIDTGVDVSLMSDKFLERFSSKLLPHHVSLTGITPGTLTSTKKFTADVEITGQCTRLTFMVVSASSLEYDVIVGCNLLQDLSLAAITDCHGTRVTRRQLPGVLRISEDFLESTKIPEMYSLKLATYLTNILT